MNEELREGGAPAGVADVAIIGIAGRFPDAPDCKALLDNLLRGVNSIKVIPEDRWSLLTHYSPDVTAPNRSTSKWLGALDGIDRFDNGFFQISPREAMSMDPQQRLLLEEAWRCVEHSGVPLAELQAKRTAVYAVTMNQDHQLKLAAADRSIDSYAAQGNYGCILANRISYVLGLRGESLLIDAACASSVVAVHHAKRALERGEIDYAIVGAVNLHTHPFKYISFAKSRFFSPEGQCKTFDKDADGYVPGEGVGVLLLRRLRDAEAAHDHIHGVIKGVAVNHVGASLSLTAPAAGAQRDVILAAYQEAGFSPEAVTYVEAHGTGTPLGDPIEIEALTRAFRRSTTERHFCGLGSVKTNIGHLDAAAGIAGMIKVLMMMRCREIPPSLNHLEPNPIIGFADSPFSVVTKRQPWQSRAPGLPLRAGISSFGFGGVNSHVLLESHEAPAKVDAPPAAAGGSRGYPFMLSARSSRSLERLLEAWRRFVDGEELPRLLLRDVCATLATGRKSMSCRFGGWISSLVELRELLRMEAPATLRGEMPAAPRQAEASWGLCVGSAPLSGGAPARALAEQDPAFSRALEQGIEALAKLGPGVPDGRGLWGDAWTADEVPLYRLIVEHAYVSRLLRLGFKPEIIAGKGQGLWAALTASGALSLEAALAALSGRLPLPQLSLSRPRVVLHDPVAERPLLPHALDEGYVRALLEGLTDPGDDLATEVRKARALQRSQFTYKKYLEEWEPALRACGSSLDQLLHDDGLLAATPERRAARRLLLLVVMTALGKLSRKWDLTPQRPPLGPCSLELLELVVDGVMSPEAAAALLTDERSEVAEAVAVVLRGRQHRLRPDGAYPLLRERGLTLPEIADVGAWLRDAQARAAAPPLAGRAWLSFGEVGGTFLPNAVAQVAVAGDLSESPEQAGLRLWLSGAELSWDEVFPQGTFDKVPLPVTSFEGPSFWLPYYPSAAPTGAAEVVMEGAADEARLDRIYAYAEWQERPLPPATRAGEPVRSVLLLARSEEARTAARGLLATSGGPVALAMPGARFRELGDLTYEVGAGPADHRRLVQELAARGLLPSDVIHAWSAPGFPEGVGAMRAQLAEGALSLVHLCQALLSGRSGAPARLLYAFATGGEVLPQHAAVGAFARALAQESGKLRCRTVEVRSAGDPRSPGATAGLWEALAQELRGSEEPGIEVRYDGRRRFVRCLREVDLESDKGAQAAPLSVREGGVYLITGGAGELGLIFAEHLAQRSAKLVLIGRSELSAGSRARIEQLGALGRATATYLRADVTRAADMRALVPEVARRFGPIRGVIHAAGVYRPAPFARKEPVEIEAILAPKVYGTLNLDEALASVDLDFFVLFSSITALKGYAGLTDYAYANSFLDHFAERREALRVAGLRAGKTLSINWPLWQDGGMVPSKEERRRYVEQSGLPPLTAGQGKQLWDIVTARAASHLCLAVYGDRAKVRAFLGLNAAVAAAEAPAPVGEAPLDVAALRAPTEQLLRQILAEETNVPSEEIDPLEGFEDYGIDSLLVHHFNTRIEKLLGPSSKTLLFEARNLSELTDQFIKNHAAALTTVLAPQERAESGGERRRGSTTPGAASAAHGDGAEAARDEDIAIIGIAGRYPGARDLDELWDILSAGRDCITEVPLDRWDHRKYYDPDPERATKGKIYAKWGAFLDGVDRFDPLFFNISPREAEMLDPQERLFLQVAWAAFEDAGYTRQGLRERAQAGKGEVGVFVGVTTNTYLLLGPGEWRAGNHAIPTSMPWSIANRVSYVLDLHGPSVPVDTACASSLTAIHLACDSLRRGEVGMALAGGVNLTLHPSKYAWMCQQRMLSPTGRCRAFGAKADGFVPGEGLGAVLLKPLRTALEDGDQIHAVISGSSSNHGGRTYGYTVPNPNAQATLILQALRSAGVDPGTVTYVEAHGTGTALGDPIEITGLTKAFREFTQQSQYCAIGSIKSNIGHLEAAAGIAGLTKILLQLRHRSLAPSLHAERLNPNIDFEQTPFYVQRELAPWQPSTAGVGVAASRPRRACISSFGAGGSNAHVVLQEYVAPPAERTAAGPALELVVLSAKTEDRLVACAERLVAFLERRRSDGEDLHCRLEDVAYTLQIGREAMDERLALLATSIEDLAGTLRGWLRGEHAPGRLARGVVKKAQQRAWTEEGAAERLDRWIGERALQSLMQAWVEGAEIDWRRVPARERRRKTSLPTYPFLSDRIWISDRDVLCEEPPTRGAPEGGGLHPLLDANASTLTEIRFRKALTGEEFFLRDHRVGEDLVLPGVAIAEMARAAGELAGERPVRKVKNVVFTSPIRAAAEPVDVYVRLQPAGEAADFEVFSGRGDERITHAKGKLVYAQAGGDEAPERVDLDAIRRRCPRSVAIAEGYAQLGRIGLRLGSSFQVNTEVHAGEVEAIGRMELPAHLGGDARRYALHPALADGAQQVTALAGLRGAEDVIQIPFSVGEYEIVGPLPETCFAYVRLLGGEEALRSPVRKFDVLLVDEAGRVLVKIKHFLSRPMQPVARRAAADPTPAPAAGEVVYLQGAWEQADLALEAPARALRRPVLVLDSGAALRDALEARLGAEGAKAPPVVLVEPGPRFARVGERGYALRAGAPEDFAALLEALQARGWAPGAVVHRWADERPLGAPGALQDQLTRGLYALLHLGQALLRRGLEDRVQILSAYASAPGRSQPQHAAIGGFGRTLQLESAKLLFRTLELRARDHAAAPPAAELAEILARELRADDTGEAEIRYEGGRRWALRLGRVDPAAAGTGARSALREGGVYLVTGGLGGLGMIFAEHLARSAGARLALVGRSRLDPGKERRLEQLRRAGAEVAYFPADVAGQDEVEALVAAVRSRFGPIHGVLHAAGVIRDALVRNKAQEDAAAVLAPKVLGAIHLDEALRNEPLDFFALFSSTTALLGNLGQSDYAYANRFLDGFAELREAWRAAGKRAGRTVSINWPLWREGGMRVDAPTERHLLTSIGMRPLSTEAGLRAFDLALATDGAHLAVIEGDPARIARATAAGAPARAQATASAARPQATASAARPQTTASAARAPARRAPYDELVPRLQRDLKRMVSAMLKIPEGRISVDRNIADYGIESVGLMDLSSQVNTKYGLEITPTLFFEHPTLEALVRHLAEEHGEGLAGRYGLGEGDRGDAAGAPGGAGEQEAPRSDGSAWEVPGVDSDDPTEPQGAYAPAIEDVPSPGASGAGARELIAIIGMSGIMPQSEDLDAFWRHLDEGRDLITEIPEERWDWRAWFGDPAAEPNKTNIRWGGFIKDADRFDARFFGISRREAELMDPQQRVFLEVVWRTIEDAGYRASDLARGRTGVFAGVSLLDYSELLRESRVDTEAYTTTGMFHSILANRISYLLNLRGPSVPVDTACSSSLVAIRQAIEAIWAGSCDSAIVGGINLLLHPMVFVSFSKAGMLSPDGRCKSFDKRANGYARAEGAGALLLKPLRRALADGDQVHAIIRGSAVNHGGKVNTMTAPNPNAQAELIISAFEEGQIDPATVTYMEAHGTGTSLGDPIEVNGLKNAFKDLFRRRGVPQPPTAYCGVGSVKSNIGHLEPAAAISGIFKVILAMKRGRIPATIHFNELNPYIQIENSPFFIVAKRQPWERLKNEDGQEIPRRAGVSSFGFGGVNGHVVLEELIPPPRSARPPAGPFLVPLSAKGEERLREHAARLLRFVEEAAGKGGGAAVPTLDDDQLARALERELVALAAQVGSLAEAHVSLHEPIAELGLDAVHAAELARRLGERLDIPLAPSVFVDFSSLGALAGYLVREHRDALARRAGAAHGPQGQGDGRGELELSDVAYTLQVGREPMEERLAVIATSLEELAAKLRAFGEGAEGVEGLWRGNALKDEGCMEALLEGGEGAEFLRTLIRNRRLDKLAQLWIGGIDIDWRLLYPGAAPRRISLPTYPFGRERFWVPRGRHEPEAQAAAALHPLLDGVDVGLSLREGVAFRKTLRRSEPMVADHEVGGRLVFPGVGQLAMAIAAVAQGKEAVAIELSQVVWLRPLVIEGDAKEARVIVRDSGGALEYEVRSGTGGDATVHSRGAIRVEAAAVVGDAERLSVDAVRARCPHAMGQDALYRAFGATGVVLGTYFRALEQVWVGEGEALAALRLPREHANEAAQHLAPPALLDAALQTMGALSIAWGGGGRSPLLPFAVERIELLRPLAPRGYVYVKAAGDLQFHAAITDEAGRVCAKLHEVTMREGQGSAAPERFYFRPSWQEASLAPTDASPRGAHAARRTTLIVAPPHDLGLGAALAAAHPGDEIVEICLGAERRQRSARAWEIPAGDPDALGACIERLGSVDRVYFLGGLQAAPADPGDLGALEILEERGALSLFRLIKALRRRGFAASRLDVTVVTNDTHEVLPGELIAPLSAGLCGLTRSLAKEHPEWSVRCLDVLRDEIGRPGLVEALVAEPGHPEGAEVALREGRRFARVLQPVRLPPAEPSPFRPEGVYVIIGGAGGIGLELALHLAATARARLALIGRRELGPDQRDKIARIEALGGQALYLRADATDPEEMRRAVAETRARFGRIHGVVHSALVLRDRLLENMDEAAFRAALAPKTRGSVALSQAIRGEALDFLLFFSSALSFTSNAGQSNYAAACTFKDAFARHLGQVRPYPVKIINWGYWGTVGVVATEEHRRRMVEQGLRSIRPEEGMAAIERVLSGPVEQVMAVHADERVLARMAVELRDELDASPGEAPPLLRAAALERRAVDLSPDVLARSLQAFDEVERFGRRLLLASVRQMGALRASGERWRREDLSRALGIAPAHARLFGALLSVLVKGGFVRLEGAEVIGTAALDAPRDAAALADREHLAAAFPERAAHIELLWACHRRYPELLRGEVPATEVLFPGASTDLVARVYGGNTISDYYNRVVAESLLAYLEARAARLPAGHTIQILEIGAGTGGTSALVLDAIRAHGDRLRYVYTDVHAGFVQQGKQRFAAASPFAEFRTLDIERDVEAQGFAPRSFDVVIATNVLHATRRISSTLGSAKGLLRARGWLILNEVTEVQDFTTLTFGLLGGWWLSEDEEIRLPGSPLLSAGAWRRLLHAEGFTPVVTLGQVDSSGRGLGQSVLIAESDGLLRRARAGAPRPAAHAGAARAADGSGAARPALLDAGAVEPTAARPEPAAARPEPAPAGATAGGEPRVEIERAILEILAEVLEVGREEIHPNAPYTSLGVDSIQSVAIVDRLNKGLGVSLRSTDLFNYPTLRKLSAHMIERFGAAIRIERRRAAPERGGGAPAPEPPGLGPLNGARRGGEAPRAPEVDLFGSPTRDRAPVASAPRELHPSGNGPPREAPGGDPATAGAPRDEAAEQAPGRPRLVAIIGMSGRFPGARDVHEFWRNLADGIDSVQEITRWDPARYYDADPRTPDKSYGKWAGMLPDVDRFDPLFFNISPKEAELMDPRQRLFLEESWKALEDAGYTDRDMDEKPCAVFVGCSAGDYKRLIIENDVAPGPHMFMGTSSSILAARVSYLLNLKGPSVPIDTACSSSLVALHLACESIRSGACEMALVGGAEVLSTPEFHVMASRTGMLSPEGRCKTFDRRADGFVPGEAVATLVLKDLEAARRDGDRIHGVIVGSGINQDGKTNGITSPSAPSQAALERAVYDRFGIDPAAITYVEAHGTGTRLGDPIEIQALTDAFRAYTDRRQYCAVGSVKTNIGHTLTASGVVGLIKVLLCMEHGKLVPSLHCEQQNDYIDFHGSPFYVNKALRDWDTPHGAPRHAAVSSFGFSGTNAHLVVREPPEQPAAARAAAARPWHLLALSAKTEEALRRRLQHLADWLERPDGAPPLRDVADTLLLRRSHFPVRTALVARDVPDLVQRLRTTAISGPVAGGGPAAANEPIGRRLLAELRAGGLAEGERRARLEQLAALYVAGCELPWMELFQGEDHRRVPLPPYPFERERYWVPERAAGDAGARGAAGAWLHPLIEANTSTFEEQRFTTELSGDEPFLRDHVVNGHQMLPGVVYLEMARASGELSAGRAPTAIQDVVWVSAFAPEGHRRRLSISLHPEAVQAGFEVWTDDADGQRRTHARGQVVHGAAAAPPTAEVVDLARIRDRCRAPLEGEACYLALQRAGFDYGPTFRVIRQLHKGDREVLARLELPSAQSRERAAYVLHPSLLDGALQSALWLLEPGSPGAARPIPFALGELIIAGHLPPSCYALVTPAGSHAGLHKFNLLMLDDAGRVLVRVHDYAVRERPQPVESKPAGAGGEAAADSALLDLFRQVERNAVDVAEAFRLLRTTGQ